MAFSRKQVLIASGVTIFEAYETWYGTRFRSIGLLATRLTGWSATGPELWSYGKELWKGAMERSVAAAASRMVNVAGHDAFTAG